MNKCREAADLYQNIEVYWPANRPEAIFGRANCARQLGNDREFEILLRQASEMLKQIPAESDPEFAETTRYDREGWQQLLDWIIQDFEKQKA